MAYYLAYNISLVLGVVTKLPFTNFENEKFYFSMF